MELQPWEVRDARKATWPCVFVDLEKIFDTTTVPGKIVMAILR